MLSDFYAKKRLSQIDKRMTELKFTVKKLPPGHLHCSKSRGRTQFYQVIGSKNQKGFSRTYLRKNQRDIAAALAKKELLDAELKDLQVEKDSLKAMLDIQAKAPKNHALYRIRHVNKKFLELLVDESNFDEYVNAWLSEPYSSSAPNLERKTVNTICGIHVRSKSEATIVSLLAKYNIPFRYECDLKINGRAIGCLDFTIMHPFTHEVFIWEHFGLLDDNNYVRRNNGKVQRYIENGFYPMVNFIITGETAEKPFDVMLADSLIQQFFLQ